MESWDEMLSLVTNNVLGIARMRKTYGTEESLVMDIVVSSIGSIS